MASPQMTRTLNPVRSLLAYEIRVKVTLSEEEGLESTGGVPDTEGVVTGGGIFGWIGKQWHGQSCLCRSQDG